jgi:hypothetical protein
MKKLFLILLLSGTYNLLFGMDQFINKVNNRGCELLELVKKEKKPRLTLQEFKSLFAKQNKSEADYVTIVRRFASKKYREALWKDTDFICDVAWFLFLSPSDRLLDFAVKGILGHDVFNRSYWHLIQNASACEIIHILMTSQFHKDFYDTTIDTPEARREFLGEVIKNPFDDMEKIWLH